MLVMVTGGSGSGKSEYAEQVVTKLYKEQGKGRLIYLATMKPYGEETRKKIERHRNMRKGKGFETVECFGGLKDIEWQNGDVILLECMSNLVADEMYDEQNKNLVEDIMAGISKIIESGCQIVVVTNEVFSDGLLYDEETLEYIRALADINCRMATMAELVTEVVCGIPVNIK